MRFTPPLALALMLGIAGSAVVATPAVAQKKAKERKPEYSKEFTAAAQAAQKAAQAKDNAALAAALPAAEAAAKTPDDKLVAANLRLQLGIATNDLAAQRAGVEGMLASGAASPADVPKFEFFAGDFAMKAKDYDKAIAHFQKSAELGYEGSAPHLMAAEANFQKAVSLSGSGGQLSAAAKPFALAGLPHLKKAIEVEKAAGAAVPAAWYDRGFSMAYLAGAPDASQWAMTGVESAPTAESWRKLLRTFQDTNRQLTRGENLDLMRLMYQTGALQSEFEYAEYADIASKSGLLGEVKSVIDQGRSKGKLAPTKLADYYSLATGGIAKDKASLPAGEAAAAKAANGRVAASTGEAYFGYGDYAKAAAMYRLALQKGSVDANEVNTRLGIALALAGDKAGANTAFGQVNGGARKQIAQFWQLWLSKKA